ncbi:hypothetical protein LAZ67_13002225 [Cordylochernes scorpioides]|uniref:RNA-directed DNA polymerase n=1 Tax=Cordylochernes scorpioides TaxID=51811 RepID=A0ABY6L7Y6_9ARAC|nr:hypothetical protein LAZ67_13002225 [Cordylochernes scorpioides]
MNAEIIKVEFNGQYFLGKAGYIFRQRNQQRPIRRKMEQGREEDPKEPMESDPDSESGENTTFPKKETTLGRTQEVPPNHEDVTPPPPVSDVLGRLTRTLHQLSAVTGLSRDVELPRYDGSYEAPSCFTNYDAQADRAQLQYSTRLRKPENLLQAPLRVTNTRAYVNTTVPFTKSSPPGTGCSHVVNSNTLIWPQCNVPDPIFNASMSSSCISLDPSNLGHCPYNLHKVLHQFAPVFAANKYDVPRLKIPPVKINTTSDKVIALRPYRVPLNDQLEIQTQIEHMLEHGIITTSVSPYASPIALVTKRDKSKRFCVDYRRINEIIAPDVHPLPLIENILDKLSRAKYFSSADISSAYWQVEIDPSSRHLSAFVTLDGQYEFCRLPFGMRNSPQIFERAINQIFQKYKLNFIAHYFDDFIIFSDTLEEHIQHLEKFLEICQQENIKLNYKKCEFLKTSIEFLGYTIKNGTYTPQTRNLDIINAIKPPFNQKTLQSFLGAVNVYNKFIPDYARLRTPLNHLLKKDTKWQWDEKCQQAFTALKESLTRKPVLHLYQDGLPCRLYCDASTQGIAGILKQVHPDGKIHPTQYYSRALRPHERNYTISELECLAIVESIEKFRIYLSGTKFTVYSDHQALQWLKTIKNPSGRLFRWSLRLSTYDYEIQYLKGTQQHEADLLSRNPFCGFISARTIKKHQPNITDTSVAVDINGLHTIRRKGVNRIIIPEALQHSLMNQVHSEYNHPGISQMARLISTQYYWKGSPKRLLSDRAPAFTSEKFRKFLLSRGIQPLLTTSNNPQANGLIERLNATITGKLRLLYLENPKTSWTKLIKQVVQIYNQSPHTVTGFPPIFLMFNSIPPELKNHYNPFPDVQKARQLASSRTQLKHERDKQRYDKGHQAPHFEIGDLVLVKNYKHPDTGKLAPYFTGPFTIIEIISPNVVRINRPNRPLNKEDDTVHVNKLKYYTEDILFLAPQPLIPTPRKELKGKRFDSDEDVQKVVQDFFHTLPKSAYKEGIYKLPERWRRCIESQEQAEQLFDESLEIEGTLLRTFPFRKRVEKTTIGKLPFCVETTAALKPFGRVTSISLVACCCCNFPSNITVAAGRAVEVKKRRKGAGTDVRQVFRVPAYEDVRLDIGWPASFDRFLRFNDSHRVRVWSRFGDKSNPVASVDLRTSRQRSIMVWGAITYDSRSPLIHIDATMTAHRFLDDVLRPDNARPHTARISQHVLYGTSLLPWPPVSSDLSPIEHVWYLIEICLRVLPQPRSEDELWLMVDRIWAAIPQDTIESVPRHVDIAVVPQHIEWTGTSLSA